MAVVQTSVTHNFQSGKTDGADTSLVRPSDWNHAHTIKLGHRDVVTTATDTLLDTDHLSLVRYDRGAGVTVTVPQPGTGVPTVLNDGWVAFYRNQNASGNVLFNATAPSTINGGTSLTLLPGQSAIFFSDGSNIMVLVMGPTTINGINGAITLGQGLSADATNKKIAVDSSFVQGFIAGLHISAAGGNNTFTVGSGAAVSDDGTTLMKWGGGTKTDFSFVAGSGNGALDTGSAANVTWYYVFLVNRPDTGASDILISLSLTAPTMPANYTKKRLIGALQTESVMTFVQQVSQYDDEFLYPNTLQQVNGATGTNTAQLVTCSTPPGLKVYPRLSILSLGGATNSDGRGYVSSPDELDEAASSANYNFGLSGSSSMTAAVALDNIRTNTSRQIRYRMLRTDATIWIGIRGFRLPRRAN
jgi:hypothetical protein